MELLHESQARIEAADSMEVVLVAFGEVGHRAFDATHLIDAISRRLDAWPQGRLVELRGRYTM